jgi:hypothetical protein
MYTMEGVTTVTALPTLGPRLVSALIRSASFYFAPLPPTLLRAARIQIARTSVDVVDDVLSERSTG